MPVYNYKAIDQSGKEVKGIVDAESGKAARAKLRKSGIFPTDLSQGSEQIIHANGAAPQGFGLKARLNRVSVEELAIMTRQMSTLLQSGIPMVESLAALIDQSENMKLKSILTRVKERVQGGSSLGDAMAEHASVFNELYINLIRAGESSGALDLVLNRLADFTESQALLKSKIQGAMVYPIILVCVCVGVLFVVFTKVIPNISKMFASSKVALPLVTRILIGVSQFTVSFWWVMLGALIALGISINRYRRTPKGRLFFDGVSLKLPVFGRIFKLVAVSRFTRTLSTLLKGGVPMLKAIDIVSAVVTNQIFSKVIQQTRDFVKEGQSLAEPLRRSGVFPPMVTHMIAIGEKTGELESMLEKVADSYDQQVNSTVGTITALIEPILILMMGGMVLFIVLSVLLPMLQMNQMVK